MKRSSVIASTAVTLVLSALFAAARGVETHTVIHSQQEDGQSFEGLVSKNQAKGCERANTTVREVQECMIEMAEPKIDCPNGFYASKADIPADQRSGKVCYATNMAEAKRRAAKLANG